MVAVLRKQSNNLMSQIVVHNGVVYLSGQVDPDFLNGAPSIAAQVAGTLKRIDELLSAAGSSKSKVLSAQILLADVADFSAMNEVWEAWIDADAPPARTTLEAKMAHGNIRVEITVVAAV